MSLRTAYGTLIAALQRDVHTGEQDVNRPLTEATFR